MRSDNFRTKFIINPYSANGSTREAWSRIQEILRRDLEKIDFSFTVAADHATTLSRQALHKGYEMIVAVGGDGTVNEVINGFFESGSLINPNAVLGMVPRGTGCDFVKTLGISRDTAAVSKILCGRTVKKCDVGHFTCSDGRGGNLERYFINIADFGIGGETVERVNRTTKVFGGFVSFLYGAVSTLLTYKSKRVKVQVDETFAEEMLINNVVIANGQYFGGGMWVAPKARVDDGLFDILIIKHTSRIQSLTSIPKLYKGTHVNHPSVTYMRGKTVTAESSDVVLLDVEGEQVGRLPARFDIVPAAINVKIGEDHERLRIS
ncbi:MAG: diacylglycerol kinase family lipid kinase [Candidatus Abyssobacteria bacterium SURF_5]|uniref:Diacylglycerol kinase family lipid kinase n=1 Tax=Abyssobacteria bacterium (strain SURF_5) TaxID=2093360 RepID=A0A3A4N7F5_ABYX5|nr:MAG: diacylglycerol kinase family lipid kinase [Candidatus Abyssubacteria bacterium SURF_5]